MLLRIVMETEGFYSQKIHDCLSLKKKGRHFKRLCCEGGINVLHIRIMLAL